MTAEIVDVCYDEFSPMKFDQKRCNCFLLSESLLLTRLGVSEISRFPPFVMKSCVSV